MSSTPQSQSATSRMPGTAMLAALAGVVVAAYVAVWLLGLDLAVRPPLPARIQADDVTGIVSLLGDLTARLAALGTLGVLAALAVFCGPGPERTILDERRPLLRWAGRLGQVWFVAAVLNTFANPAYVNGVPLHTTMTPASWWTFLWASPSALAWLVSALVAAAIVVASYTTRHRATPLIGLVAGVASLTFVAATGNVTVGLDHDWATDAVVVLTLCATVLLACTVGAWLAGTPASGRRYHRLALPLVGVAAAGHAVVAWQQLAGRPLTATPYGWWTIGIFAVLGLLALSWVLQQATGSRTPASVVRDVVLAVAYLACLTAENHVPPPRFLEPQSIMVNYLGYEVVVGPTIARLVSLGRPNLLWVCIVVFAIGIYLAGASRARRLGRPWPWLRTLAWVAAWLLTLFLAVTGLWEYSTVQYSWHMVVHMTVNMLVPVLAVLGAPLALARAASGPATDATASLGETVDALEAHPVWQALTSPPVAWVAYVGSLFVVYFTSAFAWLMKYHWAHQVMLLFFMVTGYLFFSLIIGADRPQRQLPHLVKLALVISIMPFHALFAVGILSSQTMIGEEFYRTISVPWLPGVEALMADQGIAGQAAWFLGEVPLFVVIAALAAQWFRSDSREAASLDERVESGEDDSLDAYNDMLVELARRDEQTRREATLKRYES